ncbi:hypothetical protein [Sulfuricurvum sp.]|uniref:hypothetical protein n=1 Tax=Sulfuricurvum sp. TaxID=2025608 RepID=UPI003BB6F0AB
MLAIASASLNKIRSHWYGNEQLKYSFWCNTICLLLAIQLLSLYDERLSIALSAVKGIIFVWMFIGTWRAANKYMLATNNTLWAWQAKIFSAVPIVLFFIATLKY